jgi:hypothetical protein
MDKVSEAAFVAEGRNERVFKHEVTYVEYGAKPVTGKGCSVTKTIHGLPEDTHYLETSTDRIRKNCARIRDTTHSFAFRWVSALGK